MDLKEFSGRARLFPLPGVTLFPRAVAPLHVFEPRYRRMTADALAGDRLIAMVRLLDDGSPRPPIETVGCLGRVIRHQRLDDGRFNLLLLGCKRIRLVREVPDPELPYRVAEAVAVDDVVPDGLDEDAARAALIERFRRTIGARVDLEDEFFRLLEGAGSLGALADVLAHALPLDAEVKQRLLAEPDVGARFRRLDAWLVDLTPASASGRDFPPPFSLN